ncbi:MULTISPECIES: alpha-mannosidase [Okeania]|nr:MULTISPECIES: alpha-mannosidase [Okeania]NES79586.1 alpha-mannosidase [Okeania sp. SIO1H4]NET23258.1 alpha-mannosidase [Okeania sp. SIO1H5]NET80005.1 alpha-mannosidase [Okeania sp. SIO1F9]NET96806.1 alpha-mannosidase [Okeania sp. SIO1H2]RQH17296.1 alpha-mannosidase [Okeania hirsuta]
MQFSIREISTTIEKLRKLTQVDIQRQWRCQQRDIPLTALENLDTWELAVTNERKHIAWKKGKQILWLGQKLIIPSHLNNYFLADLSLKLSLTWWAESAEIYVNGKLVQTGDLFDCSSRILLTPKAMVGETFLIGIKLVSPVHDWGALVKSWCVYENVDNYQLDPGLLADELEILVEYLAKVETENDLDIERIKYAVNLIDWQSVGEREKFEECLIKVNAEIVKISEKYINSLKLKLLGHAHLDLAWLWDVKETWEVAQRTFESVLNLQQDFPELIFCHSTPALYEWIEINRPDLFNRIKAQVELGKWEFVGGLWVEPELNTVSGESIVRQVLYGQGYFWDKFGRFSLVAWLPDSFGFCWQLPQILQGGGMEYFVTQKLRWNDFMEFPFEVFWWEGLDKSRIFSLMLPPIGESIDVVKMGRFACEWLVKTSRKNVLWLPGVGDHGGGPTRDMLEVGKRWRESGFFPLLEFTTAENFLVELVGEGSDDYPVWGDELYLEFHRGCYTTHADQKRWNRCCEGLLYEAELFAVFASVVTGAFYRKNDLEVAWKGVLFNQFHDILPGSAISDVYVDANNGWRESERLGLEILDEAMEAIASHIDFCPPFSFDSGEDGMFYRVIVFNSLNWQRSELVSVALPAPPEKKDCWGVGSRQQGEGLDMDNYSAGMQNDRNDWLVYDNEGKLVSSQVSDKDLLFVASDVPGVGYRVFWLCCGFSGLDKRLYMSTPIPHFTERIAEKFEFVNTVSLNGERWLLENDLLRVKVEGETGNLESIFDKINEREVLGKGKGNELQAFQDEGQYWDAWNIDPNYQEYPLAAAKLIDIGWMEKGDLRSCLRVIRKIGKSEFCQDYILEFGSPLLKIKCWVNWQESHTLVKAAFPINIETDFVTYEIPCGAIKRMTKFQTERDQAKWEVPALRWADISDDNYGVSLLNDCKYGYDAKSNELRLTLLRGSTWPDEEADVGIHEFTYAIYPHLGSWESAGTVQRGYELNLPLLVKVMPWISSEKSGGRLPQIYRFLGWETDNLILMALKRSENNQYWILRCYECLGREAILNLESDAGLAVGKVVDLLERDVAEPSVEFGSRSCEISPWKIISFTLDFLV